MADTKEGLEAFGDVLAVGKIVGRVVRLFRQGFAVRFIALQDPDLLEHLLLRA